MAHLAVVVLVDLAESQGYMERDILKNVWRVLLRVWTVWSLSNYQERHSFVQVQLAASTAWFFGMHDT